MLSLLNREPKELSSSYFHDSTVIWFIVSVNWPAAKKLTEYWPENEKWFVRRIPWRRNGLLTSSPLEEVIALGS